MVNKTKEILSKETAIALKAELARYADTFAVEDTQKILKEVVNKVASDLLKKWLNENIDKVAREILREELDKTIKKQLAKNRKK